MRTSATATHAFSQAEIDAVMALPPPDRDGVYLEVLAGPVYTHAAAVVASRTSSVRGIGAGVQILLGTWASHNLMLGAQAGATSALGPVVGGTAIPSSATSTTLTTVSAGANVTYVGDGRSGRLSAGLICTQVRLIDRSTRYVITGTGFGPGLELGGARDWWIGGSRRVNDWSSEDSAHGGGGWATGLALGVAARASISRQSDLPRGISFTTIAATIALSASYD